MRRNKLLVLFMLLACFFSLTIIFCLPNSPFNTPVYARMGSTGGGSDSGGGFSSSGGGFSGDSDDDGGGSADFVSLLVYLLINILMKLLDRYPILIVPTIITGFILYYLYTRYIGQSDRDPDSALLAQNMTIAHFEHLLGRLHLYMALTDPEKDYSSYIGAYADAEYLYGQLIRQYITGNHDTSSLRRYLGGKFYNNMVREIRLKARHQTADDVIVSHAAVREICYYENYIILKIEAYGIDNEYQINAGFKSSFKQEHWADYVIFDDNFKIVNIVYGEHFHLNGIDFNHQEGLIVTTGYTEEDLRKEENDLFK